MAVVADNLHLYWQGFEKTLMLAVVSGFLALILGTIIGAFRVSPVAPLRWLSTVYVEVVRNTPLTLVFFFFVFIAPQIGIELPFAYSAIVALTVYTASFVCEAVRSGINSVGAGQAEAARAVGLTFIQSLSFIVFPQAMRSVVPPLINIFIALAKNTSIAGGFFIAELFGVARQLANANPASVVQVLIGVGAAYLLITVPAGLLASHVERKVAFAR